MKNHSAQNSGFSIIELMTVVVIISVVSLLAMANYRRGSLQTALDNQAVQFVQDLRQSQEWALSAREIDGAVAYGYGIYVRQGAGSYVLYSDINNNKRYDSGVDQVNKTVELDKRIEISLCQPDRASINYIAPDLTAKIVGNGGQSQTLRTVFRAKNDYITREVMANIAGLVYVVKK